MLQINRNVIGAQKWKSLVTCWHLCSHSNNQTWDKHKHKEFIYECTYTLRFCWPHRAYHGWKRWWGQPHHHKGLRAHRPSWASHFFSWQMWLACWFCSLSSSVQPSLFPSLFSLSTSLKNTLFLALETPFPVMVNRWVCFLKSTLCLGYQKG